MARPLTDNAEAGPSSRPGTPQAKDGFMTIPSTGLEYYKYRRALFLAGLPPPELPTPPPEHLTVPIPPPPLTYTAEHTLSPKLAKLDKVLSRKGATKDAKVRERVDLMLADLRRGRVLGKGMTLSLMIKIYKYEWTLEGLWPIDPVTNEPAIPPDSPIASVPDLPNANTQSQDKVT